MGEAAHAFLDFHVDVAVWLHHVSETVFRNDFFRDEVDVHPHASKMFHGSVEAEVFDVQNHVASPWRGHHTVDVDFDGRDAAGFGANIVGTANEVAPNCQASAFGLCFLGAEVADKAGTSDCFFSWDLVFADEEDGVGALNAEFCRAGIFPHSLSKASKFVGTGVIPHRLGFSGVDEALARDMFACFQVDDLVALVLLSNACWVAMGVAGGGLHPRRCRHGFGSC